MREHLKGIRSLLLSGARRRRALLLAGTMLGAGAVTVGYALPAGATVTPPQNSLIVGSGSSTTYNMMQALDTIFNQSPGCQVAVTTIGATQPLNFSCVGGQYTVDGNPVDINPFNDAAVEEPPIGSSNGIAELQDSGANGAAASVGVSQDINFARSSRAPKSSDSASDNFVAYAKDGVSWLHFVKVDSAYTPSHDVVSLNATQLEDIYDGTYYNWDQIQTGITKVHSEEVPAYEGDNAPIIVVSAQNGSGTESTFSGYINALNPSAPNAVNCLNGTGTGGGSAIGSATDPVPPGNSGDPSGTCYGPDVIFENELGDVSTHVGGQDGWSSGQSNFVDDFTQIGQSTTGLTQAQLESDMIFFYSYGKYVHQGCTSRSAYGTDGCGLTTLGTGNQPAFGELGDVATIGCGTNNYNPECNGTTYVPATYLDGITASESDILATTGTTFPLTRYLFNVYSNGSVQTSQTDTLVGGGAITDGTAYPLSQDNVLPGGGIAPLSVTCSGTTETYPDSADFTLSSSPVGGTGNDSSWTITFTSGSTNFPTGTTDCTVTYDYQTIPEASGATLNYVSEVGFICNPKTVTTVDPNTGDTYISEIQAAIEGQGFFPLSDGIYATTPTVNQTPLDEGATLPHPASALLANTASWAADQPTSVTQYASYDTAPVDTGNGQTQGFCEVYYDAGS